MPSFSSSLEKSIHSALKLANERNHELATLEHLLLALLDEKDASNVLLACDVNVNELRTNIENFLNNELGSLVTEVEGSEAVPTTGFQRVIQRAAIHVQSSGRNEVTGANVLVAIFSERESHAAYFLQEKNMTRYDAVNFIAHGVSNNPNFGENKNEDNMDEQSLENDKKDLGKAVERALKVDRTKVVKSAKKIYMGCINRSIY